MKKVILLHVLIVVATLLVASSPWLLLFLLEAREPRISPELGFSIGQLGTLITPLGLMAVGVYIVIAIFYNFFFTRWQKARHNPAMQGYIRTWLVLAGAGTVICLAAFLVSALLKQRANRAQADEAILSTCAAQISAPIASPWQNGPIAVGVYISNPADGQEPSGLLILNIEVQLLPEVTLLPLSHKVHSLAWSPVERSDGTPVERSDGSPDGQQIVFSDEINLYLLDPRTLSVRPLTAETVPAGNASLITNPAWSHDGSLIYFDKRLAGEEAVDLEIFALQPDGSGLRQLTDARGYSVSPQPSPDGSQIAFVSNRDGGSAIYIMDSAGSNPRRLTSGDGEDTSPTWSPDGQWLAYLSKSSGAYQIHLLNVATGGFCQLTAGDLQPGAPVWSPDGKYIFFHDLANGALKLYTFQHDQASSGLQTIYSNQKLTILSAPAWAAAQP